MGWRDWPARLAHWWLLVLGLLKDLAEATHAFVAWVSEQRKSVKPPMCMGRCMVASLAEMNDRWLISSPVKRIDFASDKWWMILLRMDEQKSRV